MRSVVKFIYFVPLTLIIVALGMRMSGILTPSARSNVLARQENPVTSIPTPTLETSFKSSVSAQESSPRIDFSGEYVCSYAGNKEQYSVYIFHNDVKVDIASTEKITHVLLADDCVYSWAENSPQGSRMCGMRQFVKMGMMLAGSQNRILNTLISQAGSQLGTSAPSLPQQFDIGRYCATGARPDAVIIPSSITFAEIKSK